MAVLSLRITVKLTLFILIGSGISSSFAQKPVNYEEIADSVRVQNKVFTASALPEGYRVDRIIIPCGEIKPRTRTPEILVATPILK